MIYSKCRNSITSPGNNVLYPLSTQRNVNITNADFIRTYKENIFLKKKLIVNITIRNTMFYRAI